MPMDRIMSQLSFAGSQLSDAYAVTAGLTNDDELQILNDSDFFWLERDGIKILVCRALAESGFVNGFSTRLGGVSAFPDNCLNLAGFDEDSSDNIHENRRRFLAALGGEHTLSTVWQVHGDTVKKVTSQSHIEQTEDRADALVSDLESLLVGVKTADCVPILIGDPTTGAFAAVHAGWRGTVRSIAAKTVRTLIENYGSDPDDLVCAIGPAASCRSYEIGQDVIDEFSKSFGAESSKYFKPTREGHAYVDLHAANRDQLIGCGVRNKNLFSSPFCTMERPDLFFSYRLEKKKYGKTGRLLSVIGREPSA